MLALLMHLHMQAHVICMRTQMQTTGAAGDADFRVHNNVAYLSPHIDIPHFAVPFPSHRKLAEESCGQKSVTFPDGVASGDPYAVSLLVCLFMFCSALRCARLVQAAHKGAL
jgi:hypothetical protein